jgi:hypothetical protein
MARQPKAYEPEGCKMIVVVACLPIGGKTIALQGDTIYVSEQARVSYLQVGAARDA